MKAALCMWVVCTATLAAGAQVAGSKSDRPMSERPLSAADATAMFQQVKHSLVDSIRTAEKHCDGRAVAAECRTMTPTGTAGEAGRDTSVVCVVTVLAKDNTLTEVQINSQTGQVMSQRRVEAVGQRTVVKSGTESAMHAADVTTTPGSPRDEFAPPRRWQKATDLTGKRITNRANENLGTLDNIVIDARSGRILYGVGSFGGFLGLGEKLFAIPWPSLQLTSDAKEFMFEVDRERLKAAQGFDKQNWPDFADERWATTTYQHYGHKPYWSSSSSDAWNQRVTVWQKSSDLCGKDARSPSGEDLGEIDDLAIDPDAGRVIYGILKHRGKLFAVPWNALTLSSDAKHFTVGVEKAALTDNVGFSSDRWPNLIDSRFVEETHATFQVQPCWQVRRDR